MSFTQSFITSVILSCCLTQNPRIVLSFPVSPNASPSPISSNLESVYSSPSSLPPLFQCWTSLNYPLSVLFPSNQLSVFQSQSECCPMGTGSTIFQLTPLVAFFIDTFQSKLLTMGFKILQDVQSHPLQSSPGSLCLTTHVFLLILRLCSGLNWVTLPTAQVHMLKL